MRFQRAAEGSVEAQEVKRGNEAITQILNVKTLSTFASISEVTEAKNEHMGDSTGNSGNIWLKFSPSEEQGPRGKYRGWQSTDSVWSGLCAEQWGAEGELQGHRSSSLTSFPLLQLKWR